MAASGTSEEAGGSYKLADIALAPVARWSSWNVGRIRLFGIFVHFKYFMVLLLELAVVAAATHYCYSQAALTQPQAATWIWAKSLFAALPFSLCFAGLGLYSSRQTLSGTGVLLRYLVASAIAIPALSIFHFMVQAHVTAPQFIVPVTIAILGLAACRVVFGKWLDSSLLKRRVLLIGTGMKAQCVHQLAAEPNQRGFSLLNVPVDLSIAGRLAKLVKHYCINEVVVAFDDRRSTLPAKELLKCRLSGVSVVDVLDFLERETGVISFEHLQPSWLIFTDGFNDNFASRFAKRSVDIIGSLVLIVLTLPLSVLTCLAIKLDRESPGPILYKQVRVGRDGKDFKVLKFRSMRTDAEVGGKAIWASANDSRITAVGAVIRQCRIDELPQLFNVLGGSMSLVGPRPERPVFVDALTTRNELYAERHRVKPGVTGWAQLRYPYTDDEEGAIQKLQYDMYYLKNQGRFSCNLLRNLL